MRMLRRACSLPTVESWSSECCWTAHRGVMHCSWIDPNRNVFEFSCSWSGFRIMSESWGTSTYWSNFSGGSQ